jgi:hypothetical protein
MEREQIIQIVSDAVKKNGAVFACWLEGADATNTVDQYSDIDIWLDVQDGREGEAFHAVENALFAIGVFDLSHEIEHPHPRIRQKFYHLAGTSEFWLIDVCIQSHSRGYRWTTGVEDPPKVLFDKGEVITFQELDEREFNEQIRAKIADLCNTFAQQSRVLSKVARGNYLEAFKYYEAWTLDPLIELLRIRYTPRRWQEGFKHFARELPAEVVRDIEDLCRMQSVDDIAKHVQKARQMFDTALGEIQGRDTVTFPSR